MQIQHVKPNFGIGGDTTFDLKQRWPTIRLALPTIRHAWVHIGLNDLRQKASPACVVKLMCEIRDDILRSGVNVTFLSVIDADVPHQSRALNNLMLKEKMHVARWHLPLHMYHDDHIHPNPLGVRLMTRQLHSLSSI